VFLLALVLILKFYHIFKFFLEHIVGFVNTVYLKVVSMLVGFSYYCCCPWKLIPNMYSSIFFKWKSDEFLFVFVGQVCT
jgi:hypothetical protein